MFAVVSTVVLSGEGICLIRNRSDLDEIIERKFDSMQREDLVSRRSNMKRIIQKWVESIRLKTNRSIMSRWRYIERPLLINKKKFDLRCYLLISSVDPLMVFYHRGYVRLSMFDFDINEKNIQVHLTNQVSRVRWTSRVRHGDVCPIAVDPKARPSLQREEGNDDHDHWRVQVGSIDSLGRRRSDCLLFRFSQYLNDKVERKQLTSIEKNWSIECLQVCRRVELVESNLFSFRIKSNESCWTWSNPFGWDWNDESDHSDCTDSIWWSTNPSECGWSKSMWTRRCQRRPADSTRSFPKLFENRSVRCFFAQDDRSSIVVYSKVFLWRYSTKSVGSSRFIRSDRSTNFVWSSTNQNERRNVSPTRRIYVGRCRSTDRHRGRRISCELTSLSRN